MGIDTRAQTASRVLLEQLCDAVESRLQPLRRVDLPALCDEIGLPTAPDSEKLTKRQYIRSRLAKVTEGDQARDVAINFANRYPLGTYGNDATFVIEEMLWQSREPEVSLRVRRGLAAALDDVELFRDAAGFIEVLGRLFILDPDGLRLWNERRTLIWKIRQHVIRNPEDWSVTQLFQEIGAFRCTSERFRRLIAALAGSEAKPDEESQRSFVAAVNSTLAADGFELAELGEVDGYPDFSFVKLGDTTQRRPKNLIFGSRAKPDLRFRDAVDNDIEIVTHSNEVLVFDEPMRGALLWRDLQSWWARHEGIEDGEQAKRGLYVRLWRCLPETSPAQRLLFKTFFEHFAERFTELPALLPEVWLHYDPKTVRQRAVMRSCDSGWTT